MPEKMKQLVEAAGEAINAIPANKREIAAKLAETYATGLAVGMELACTTGHEQEGEETT